MNEYRKLQYEVETLREHIAELNQLNHTTGLTEHEQGLLMDYHSTLNLKEHIKAALKTKILHEETLYEREQNKTTREDLTEKPADKLAGN